MLLQRIQVWLAWLGQIHSRRFALPTQEERASSRSSAVARTQRPFGKTAARSPLHPPAAAAVAPVASPADSSTAVPVAYPPHPLHGATHGPGRAGLAVRPLHIDFHTLGPAKSRVRESLGC